MLDTEKCFRVSLSSLVTKVGTLPLSGAACAGGCSAVRSLYVHAVGGSLSGPDQ